MATGTVGVGTHVDLNSDLGESFGAYTIGNDELVVPVVSSVNVACGMHAGDPRVMRRTVAMAAEHGIAVGAHPGYPDLQGFGRRDMALTPEEVYCFVLYQIGALDAFCHAEGVALHHVKPHGQLYNRAAREQSIAESVARAVRDYDESLVLVGLAGSELVKAGRAMDLCCAEEFFADRAYTAEGTLVPRTQPGALIDNEQFAIERTLRAVRVGVVRTVEGSDVAVRADTVCVHGDSSHALDFARALRAAFEGDGVEISPYHG